MHFKSKHDTGQKYHRLFKMLRDKYEEKRIILIGKSENEIDSILGNNKSIIGIKEYIGGIKYKCIAYGSWWHFKKYVLYVSDIAEDYFEDKPIWPDVADMHFAKKNSV